MSERHAQIDLQFDALPHGAARAPFDPDAAGEAVEAITLKSGRFGARILTYGATIQAFWVDGVDILLGHDTMAGYRARPTGYLGATIGRLGNRIRNGAFEIAGQRYQIGAPEDHGLHGGPEGFHARIWQVAEVTPVSVTLDLLSADGDQGYPAEVHAQVTYALTPDGLMITHRATATAPTPVSMTNHAYLNLGAPLEEHLLQLNATRYLPGDADGIPLGAPAEVAGTVFDFRAPKAIGAGLAQPDPQLTARGGFDHAFCLDGDGLREVGRLSVEGGLQLALWTDQPSLMFYSGNFLGDGPVGKGGQPIGYRTALCLEPQAWPDSPNHPEYPFTLTTPAHPHLSRIEWRFGR